REIQMKYNAEHNKTPQPLNKKINALNSSAEQFELNPYQRKSLDTMAAEERESYGKMSAQEKDKKLAEHRKLMEKSAANLDFIEAAKFRDKIKELQGNK